VGGYYCNASSTCVLKLTTGSVCTAPNQCQSNQCIDGYCCNTQCAGDCDSCGLSGSEGTCTVVADGAPGDPACAPYLCNGASPSCPSSCASELDCSSGNYCDGSNHCVTQLTDGSTCTLPVQCQSDHCVDGYCCDSACAEPCDACNVSPSEGTCTVLGQGSVGAPSCSPYVCDGSQSLCPTTCTGDPDCSPGNYCDAGNHCAGGKANGGSCSTGTECQSGICADDVCCDDACVGDCNGCDLSGSEGTCTLMAPGAPGDASCSPYLCSGASADCPSSCSDDGDCASGFYCGGSSQCVAQETTGTGCTRPEMCQSGFCADGYCCDSACGEPCDACDLSGLRGTCSNVDPGDPGDPTCAPYLCDGAGALCPSSCGDDGDCTSGYYCDGTNHCAAKLGDGEVCGGSSECQSGECTNGYCCDVACSGSCESCDQSGLEGTCTAFTDGTPGSPSCAPYLCDGGSTCPSTCAGDVDCTSGNYCDGSNHCSGQKVDGEACGGDNECQSGECTDGYCCDSVCGGSCDACDLSGYEGECRLRADGDAGDPSCGTYLCDGAVATCPSTCADDADCVSGNYCNGTSCVPLELDGTLCSRAEMCQSNYCVDGYCCDAACGGSCGACDLSGDEGTCTALASGSAGDPSCGAYVCNGTSTSCPSSCSSDANCASGNYCDASSECVPLEAQGTACSRAGECLSNFCADGYCCNAACTESCNVCNASGFEGTCSVAPGGSSGNPDCTPYLCDGMLQTCPSSCSVPADCADGYTCDASNECVPSGGCSGGTYDCDGDGGNGCECTIGTGCCGSGCQITHDNGIGQSWYDCVAYGTHTQAQATKACEAYAGSGECGSRSCLSGQRAMCSSGATAPDCICWGYQGAIQGWVNNAGGGGCQCGQSAQWN
jgi:hypothetical protein